MITSTDELHLEMSYVLQVATEKSDKTKNVAGHNQGRTRMVDVGFAGRLNTIMYSIQQCYFVCAKGRSGTE